MESDHQDWSLAGVLGLRGCMLISGALWPKCSLMLVFCWWWCMPVDRNPHFESHACCVSLTSVVQRIGEESKQRWSGQFVIQSCEFFCVQYIFTACQGVIIPPSCIILHSPGCVALVVFICIQDFIYIRMFLLLRCKHSKKERNSSFNEKLGLELKERIVEAFYVM